MYHEYFNIGRDRGKSGEPVVPKYKDVYILCMTERDKMVWEGRRSRFPGSGKFVCDLGVSYVYLVEW